MRWFLGILGVVVAILAVLFFIYSTPDIPRAAIEDDSSHHRQ